MNQYTQEPIPNIIEAVNKVMATLVGFMKNFNLDEQNFYNEYTPQIVSTNELQQIYELKNHIKPDAKVLTVSASGEQPLFCKLYGAKYVVTFDISYNSYLLTSVKIAALQAFNKNTDYEKFVYDLSHYCKPGQLMDTPKMDYIFPYLSNTQKNHLRTTDEIGIPVFLQDISCNFYNIPQEQYENLRQSVKTPFPFIWTNIIELDKKLGNENFDLVYYSNILSFMNDYQNRLILQDTKKHIKPNGKLFLVTGSKHLGTIMDAIDDTFREPDWNIQLFNAPTEKDFMHIIVQHNQNNR
jgi:hypothetical protein